MRRLLYRVTASLDGYIAGFRGEVDWIVHDPAVDFAKVYESVDTVLVGRRTYELTRQSGAPPWPQDWQIYVFSRTLGPEEHPGVTVVRVDAGSRVAALRAAPGRAAAASASATAAMFIRNPPGPSRRQSRQELTNRLALVVAISIDRASCREWDPENRWASRSLTRACSRRCGWARGVARAAPSGGGAKEA